MSQRSGSNSLDNGSGLCVRNVTVTYSNGHTAIRDASFELPRGTIAALVGVNGSGKSTLFKSIMGFAPIIQGNVSILGEPVAKVLKNNLVAYVPQTEDIDWNFPVLVEDVVMMGRFGHMGFFRHPGPKDHLKVADALRRVNMQSCRKRQIGALSGGQKKRVFLARALAQEGEVILLDEPFTGVDVQTEDTIISLLRELRDEGKVILVSTHNLGSVTEFCDHAVLVKGTILTYGPTPIVFTQKNLEQAFGGVLRRFVFGGTDLHNDEDHRKIAVFTDDERPLVMYGKEGRMEHKSVHRKNDH